MQIAVDAMGGDFAPRSAVEGAVQAAAGGTRILLVGDRSRIEVELDRCGGHGRQIAVVHADQAVAMEDRALAVRQKRDSSIWVCARLVKEGRARAVVTAGNTGAAMFVAKTVIGTIPGVDRPALAAVFPRPGGWTVVLDVGANVGARTAHLRQFAVMGHFYAQGVCATDSPRIGLMSVGEEEGKGTEQSRQALRVLRQTGLNFVGNVEGRDVFSGSVDVIVCDGFVGNVMLKSLEALADTLDALVRDELRRSWRTRLGHWLAKPALAAFAQRTHWSEHGAVPLLGLQGGFFVAHGHSNAHAIRNAVRRAVDFCDNQLDVKIRERVAQLHAREAEILADSGGGS